MFRWSPVVRGGSFGVLRATPCRWTPGRGRMVGPLCAMKRRSGTGGWCGSAPTGRSGPRSPQGQGARVAIVVELTSYPIKGCAGVPVSETLLPEAGLRHDRSCMVIGEDGVCRTQRWDPRLAVIRPPSTPTANGSPCPPPARVRWPSTPFADTGCAEQAGAGAAGARPGERRMDPRHLWLRRQWRAAPRLPGQSGRAEPADRRGRWRGAADEPLPPRHRDRRWGPSGGTEDEVVSGMSRLEGSGSVSSDLV